MLLASILKTFAEVLASALVDKKKKKEKGKEVVFRDTASHTSQINICSFITIIQGKQMFLSAHGTSAP